MKIAAKTRKMTRQRLHARVRTKVNGSTERPRLSISFTNSHIHTQIIDDTTGRTLIGISTNSKEIAAKKIRPNVAGATEIGKLIAQKAKTKNIKDVIFDRGGFKFHGRVKALAEAAREAGLNF